MDQLAGGHHGHGLDVGGHVAEHRQQTVEQGLQSRVSGGYYLKDIRKV